ncbi:MAG: hypothetical protein KF795_04095 [Labilithrix sp.]|nr:hypothetical protein [Labilithrix sp.]
MHVPARVVGAVVALATLAAIPAHAGAEPSGQLALVLDGVESGYVRSTQGSAGTKRTLVISTAEPTAPILTAVRALLEGKTESRSLVLSTPAVIQKAKDARLVDVRLPSYAGGSSDLALTFEVGSTSTGPSLRLASDRAKPRGVELASFRMSVGDLPTSGATRLDAVTLKNKEGAALPGAFTFDVPSRDAPAYLAWAKKPAARDGAIEYVSKTGEPALAVKLSGCTPSSATIDGPVTHVVVTCVRARPI